MYLSAEQLPGYRFELGSTWLLSVTIFLLGVAVIAISGLQFRKASTTVNPLTPEKSSALVVTGLYRISRNPMYIGFFLFLLSICIYLANIVTLVFLPLFVLVINRFQIQPEEKVLETIFGDEYRQYSNRVRRWI